jgi:hypothetical protein
MAARAVEHAPPNVAGHGRRSNAHAGDAAGSRLQAKLTVGPTRDRFEAEADRLADQVTARSGMANSSPPATISSLPPSGPAYRKAAGSAPEELEEKPPLIAQSKAETGSSPPEEPEDPIADLVTQRDAAGPAPAGSFNAPASVETAISGMRSGPAGRLDPATRTTMESGIGRDFSNVRIHDGANAAGASRALRARAFTVGNDVFFGAGQYRPQTTSGKRLIAHELTHTVQQAGGSGHAQPARIQRDTPAGGDSQIEPDPDQRDADDAPPPDVYEHPRKGKIDLARNEITLPNLELPDLQGALKGASGGQAAPAATSGTLPVSGASYTLGPVPARDPSSRAYQVWTEYAESNWAQSVQRGLTEHLAQYENAADVQKNGEQVFFLRRGSSATASSLLIGTASEISHSDLGLRPQWTQGGGEASLDADHILEWQLGGADSALNMWLLSSQYNQTIGNQIKNRVRDNARTLLDAAHADDTIKEDSRLPPASVAGVTSTRQSWTYVFSQVKSGRGFARAPRNAFWTKAQIQNADHLRVTRPLDDPALINLGLKFEPGTMPTRFLVFPNEQGGKFAEFRINRDGSVRRPNFFFPGLQLVGTPTYDPPASSDDPAHALHLRIARQTRRKGDLFQSTTEQDIDVLAQPHLGAGGYVNREQLLRLFHGASFTKLSPVNFAEMGLDANGVLLGAGEILATKFLFPGLHVPLTIHGTDVFISFPVPTESLSFGPLEVTEAALNLGVGENGFFVEGLANLIVASVGSGQLAARVERDDVILSGSFQLDMDFLNPAELALSYSFNNDVLSGTATLGVQSEALPGIEGGEVTVTFSNDSLGVTGRLDLGGPLSGSQVTVGYTPQEGLSIAASDIPLPVERLPGISGATVSVAANRNPETGAWVVSGSGSADIDAPAASGSIDVTYNAGAVLIHGQGEVAAGPATGTIDVTVTNMPIDEEGNPVEGTVTDTFSAWGRGTASMTFGDILTGTAGLEFTPDGRVIVSGEIALPPRFDVFDRVEYNRQLLALETPEFPIWGLSIAGIGFGIFASADGYINFDAWIGPGTIEDARIGAEMDLARPQDATVTGGARFVVPAYAGLRLGIGANLTARAAVAFVRGRVGITGDLGLGVEGGIDIGVNWSQATGLELDASASVEAQPKFRIGVEASVTAGVDLVVKEVSKTFGPWERTLGEFGPDMTLGVTMPGRWTEADGLDLDINDIVVRQPSFDTQSVLDSAFDSVTG